MLSSYHTLIHNKCASIKQHWLDTWNEPPILPNHVACYDMVSEYTKLIDQTLHHREIDMNDEGSH